MRVILCVNVHVRGCLFVYRYVPWYACVCMRESVCERVCVRV